MREGECEMLGGDEIFDRVARKSLTEKETFFWGGGSGLGAGGEPQRK